MRRLISRQVIGLLVAGWCVAVVTSAQQPAPAPTQGAPQGAAVPGGRGGPAAPATVPFENPRNAGRHQGFLEVAKAGNIDLLFVGDSITDGWRKTGLEVWNKYFAPLKAANFGIGGDHTGNVLWRLKHDGMEKLHPKVVVLLIDVWF